MYRIDLNEEKRKEIYPLGDHFYGKSPKGDEIDFTNYYLRKNGKPIFGISGEFHFSRCSEIYWRDELEKMKCCGINVVSTYIFWNHHEETEGEFCFEGRRDIRKFVSLCQEVGLYVIVRIGPFDHGEVRNGGFPDWIYGKPFEVRALNDGFFAYVKRLYEQIGQQTEGLFFKDGGPIIGAQLDNEYQHSAAPWEQTTGISEEWVPGGSDGDAYMLKLQEIATEAGIIVPVYTCTAWGGAVTPENMMPLWGGYAYRPWLFYSFRGEHPATEEYRYSDFHNDKMPQFGDFTPAYKPESRPYACCEMGGGMMCSYYYRFQLPYKSVDAMANIKIASGCNFLGYYVFKGGTNPKGKYPEFLNEGQVPKLSYDYQAAIGEFGQLRESYKRLKALHYFTEYFSEQLCETVTYLPEGAMNIDPKDADTLRYAVRRKGNSGFVFINNFQDHMQMREKQNEEIFLELPGECISLASISLAAEENCILPFNMDLSGILLKYALAQPVAFWEENGDPVYLFMIPEGMEEKFVFEPGTDVLVKVHAFGSVLTVQKDDIRCRILTVSRAVMNDLYLLQEHEKTSIIIADAAILADRNGIRLETADAALKAAIYHNSRLTEDETVKKMPSDDPVWDFYHIMTAQTASSKDIDLELNQVGPTRYTLDIPKNIMEGVKDMILQLDYEGDIGQAFIDGDMIHDNFANGAAWEIGLKTYAERLRDHSLTIYITPLKSGAKVNVESAMAARKEEVAESRGRLFSVRLKPVYEKRIVME